MPVKDHLKDAQDVENRRHVALADQPPKLVAGELRYRTKPALEKRIVASQWGDGFGMATCEIAHLCLEGQLSIARVRKQTLVRVFIDVI